MSWVRIIILINLATFGICNIFTFWGLHLENLFALYPIHSDYFSLYQLVTHLFIHGNPEHLFFNMLFFLFCGNEVEEYLGKKFIYFYLLSGIFSSGLYCLGSESALIGASGAVFSIMTFSVFLMISSNKIKTKWMYKFKTIFLIYFIVSEYYLSTLPTKDNIGHLVHVFGTFFAIIYFFKSKYSNNN